MPLSRRAFLQQLAASSLVLTGCKSGEPEQPAGATEPKRPNVLMLVVDDLNDWVGYLGTNPQVQTPHMDALAAAGTRFMRAYCNAPLCNPSRASALTGLLPSRTHVIDNTIRLREGIPDAYTLPQHFKSHGYNTYGLGKVFHSDDPVSWTTSKIRPADPVPAGDLPKQFCKGPVDSDLESQFNWDWAPLDVTDHEMSDGKVADWAIELLGQSHTKPFFMGVGMFKPHTAWYVPQKYFDLYPVDSVILPDVLATDADDIPPSGLAQINTNGVNFHDRCIVKPKAWQPAVQGYLASISFADAQIGRVLNALANSQYADNTIVVLWSDNGFHLGEKLRWHKHALWEKTIRVPFMIKLPKDLNKGGVVDAGVSLLDMYPTLVDYCGLPLPAGLQGRSLRPLISNPAIVWQHPALTIMDGNHYSLRTEKWRYIRYNNGDEELYDHDVDGKEWNNLAANPAYDDLKKELYATMLTLI